MIDEFRKEMAALVAKYEEKGLSIERVLVSYDENSSINLRIVYTENIFKNDTTTIHSES